MLNKIMLSFVLIVFMSGSLAFAQSQEENKYKPFNIEIPTGWLTEYREGSKTGGQFIKATSPDKQAFLSMEIFPLQAGEWQKLFDQMHNKPQPDHTAATEEGPNSFVITFVDNKTGGQGVKKYQILDDNRYIVQIYAGYHNDLPQLISSTTTQ